MRLLEMFAGVVYLAFGFRYVFAHVYPEIVRDEFKKLEKVYNNAIGRWEEVKVRKTPEGTWNDVIRAFGWSVVWMWVWPAWLLVHTGEHTAQAIGKHDAHKLATTIAGKRNPSIKRIDTELRELHIKQLEKETGIDKEDG